MNFTFTDTLSTVQLSDVMQLYSAQEVVSLEQYPEFVKAIEPDVSLKYLLAYRDGQLIGYSCVKIKKRVLAYVYFGPMVSSPQDYEEVCAGLVSVCRGKGVLVLKIMPPYMSDERKAAMSSFQKIKYTQSDSEFNWASLKLSLDKPMEEILKGFSDNHRQSVKKAQKLNLTADVITDVDDLNIFAEQYIQMYQSRALAIDPELIRHTFKLLFDFYRAQDTGVFLAVRSPTEGIVGGVCISYQGDSGFYQKGYSHPDHRSLPINHLAIYEAIKLSKEHGLKVFDFGGYGLNLKEDDQVHAINRFKAWFGGELVYHPQTLTIYTTPFSKLIYDLYLRLRKPAG